MKLSYKEMLKRYITDKGFKIIRKKDWKRFDVICDKGHTFSYNITRDKECPRCYETQSIPVGYTSKPEKEVVEYVKSIYDFIIKENDRSIVQNPNNGHMLELDIYLPMSKKAIEFNGEYYHSDKETMKRDQIKLDQCKSLGIDLLVITYKEWITDKMKCHEIIKTFLTYK